MDVRQASQSTYDRVSRAKDRGAPGPPPELAANRAAQDIVADDRHRQFDLQARDKTPKSARHHWSVVGEGSHTALENFLNGYSQIDWSS